MYVFTVCAIEENINTQPLTSDQENYVTNMQAWKWESLGVGKYWKSFGI